MRARVVHDADLSLDNMNQACDHPQRDMRKLRLVVRTTRGTLPLLLVAGVVPTNACGSRSGLLSEGSGGAMTDASVSGGSGGSGGLSTGGSGGGINVGGSGGTGGVEGFCPPFSMDEEFVVDLPLEGTPAQPGQICAATVEPVASNRAARLTLSAFTDGGQTATGFIEIDPALEPLLVGTPKLQILDASRPDLLPMTASALQKTAGGFSFQANWPAPLKFSAFDSGFGQGFARMTAQIEFEVACVPSPTTRLIHAAHDLHLCLDDQSQDVEWVSSGDKCVVCRIIAEMAPSPIVPDKRVDGLPLAQALRLRVVELARIANTVVLFAENDGGDGLDYEWHPSVGVLQRLAADIVAWTIEPGSSAPLMQVAVWGSARAGVASFCWNEAV